METQDSLLSLKETVVQSLGISTDPSPTGSAPTSKPPEKVPATLSFSFDANLRADVDGKWELAKGITLENIWLEIGVAGKSGRPVHIAIGVGAMAKMGDITFEAYGQIPEFAQGKELTLILTLNISSSKNVGDVIGAVNDAVNGDCDTTSIEDVYSQVQSKHFPFNATIEISARKPVNESFFLQSLYLGFDTQIDWRPNIENFPLVLKDVGFEISMFKRKAAEKYSFTVILNGGMELERSPYPRLDIEARFSKHSDGDIRLGIFASVSTYNDVCLPDLLTLFDGTGNVKTESIDQVEQSLCLPDELSDLKQGLTSDTLRLEADVELRYPKSKDGAKSKLSLSQLVLLARATDLNLKLPLPLDPIVLNLAARLDLCEKNYEVAGTLFISDYYLQAALAYSKDNFKLTASVDASSQCTIISLSNTKSLNVWGDGTAEDTNYLLTHAQSNPVQGEPPVSLENVLDEKTGVFYLSLDFNHREKVLQSLSFYLHLSKDWAIIPDHIVLENLEAVFEVTKKSKSSGRDIRGFLIGECSLQKINSKLYGYVEGSRKQKSSDFEVGFLLKHGENNAMDLLKDPVFGSCTEDGKDYANLPSNVWDDLASGKLKGRNEKGDGFEAGLMVNVVSNSTGRKLKALKLHVAMRRRFEIFDTCTLATGTLELQVENPTTLEERKTAIFLRGDIRTNQLTLELTTHWRKSKKPQDAMEDWKFEVTAKSQATPKALFATDVLGPKDGATLDTDTADYSSTKSDVPESFPVNASTLLEGHEFRCLIEVGTDPKKGDQERKLKRLLFTYSTNMPWTLLDDAIRLERAALQFLIENPRSQEVGQRKTAFLLLGYFFLGKDNDISAFGKAQYSHTAEIITVSLRLKVPVPKLTKALGITDVGINDAIERSPVEPGHALDLGLEAKVKTKSPQGLSAFTVTAAVSDMPITKELTLAQLALIVSYLRDKKPRISLTLDGTMRIGTIKPLFLRASMGLYGPSDEKLGMKISIEAAKHPPVSIAKRIWGGKTGFEDQKELPTPPKTVPFSNWLQEDAIDIESGLSGFADIYVVKKPSYKLTRVLLGLDSPAPFALIKDWLWLEKLRLFIVIDLQENRKKLGLSCTATLKYKDGEKEDSVAQEIPLEITIYSTSVVFTIQNFTTGLGIRIATMGQITIPDIFNVPIFPTVEATLDWKQRQARLDGFLAADKGDWKPEGAFGKIVQIKQPRLSAVIKSPKPYGSIKGTASLLGIDIDVEFILPKGPLLIGGYDVKGIYDQVKYVYNLIKDAAKSISNAAKNVTEFVSSAAGIGSTAAELLLTPEMIAALEGLAGLALGGAGFLGVLTGLSALIAIIVDDALRKLLGEENKRDIEQGVLNGILGLLTEDHNSGPDDPPINLPIPKGYLPGTALAATAFSAWRCAIYCQNVNGGICEMTHNRGKWVGNAKSVRFYARLFTPLAAVSWDDGKEIRVFYLNRENALREYCYSGKKWTPGKLNERNIITAPDSQLAATQWIDQSGINHIHLFFQEPNEQRIQEYRHTTSWVAGTTITSALPGSGLAAVNYEQDRDKRYIRLYYQNKDLSLKEFNCWNNGTWTNGTFNYNNRYRTSMAAFIEQSPSVLIGLYWQSENGGVMQARWSNGWNSPGQIYLEEPVKKNTQISAMVWQENITRFIRLHFQSDDRKIQEAWLNEKWGSNPLGEEEEEEDDDDEEEEGEE